MAHSNLNEFDLKKIRGKFNENICKVLFKRHFYLPSMDIRQIAHHQQLDHHEMIRIVDLHIGGKLLCLKYKTIKNKLNLNYSQTFG